MRLIRPALAAGRWVVCDRFIDSMLAYQGYGRGVPIADLLVVQRFATGGFTPDLTLILDLPVREGLRRAGHRGGGGDRFERLDVSFHERLRNGFLQIAAGNPERCVVIAAGGGVETVRDSILDAVRERLGVSFAGE
jgi:dTMP kinase